MLLGGFFDVVALGACASLFVLGNERLFKSWNLIQAKYCFSQFGSKTDGELLSRLE